MSTQMIATKPAPSMVDQSTAALIENVVIKGDISKLSAAERNHYYQEVCRSCGLNALTRPFEYLILSGKMTLYARKDATDQLRTIHKVSVDELNTELRGDVFVVTVKVRNAEGRTDMATGAVPVGNLKGDALANAFMKAETKAKRRATLSICGLGLLDETELETIPEKAKLKLPPTPSRPIPAHDPSTGELNDEIPNWGDGPRDHERVVPAPSPEVAQDKAGASQGNQARAGEGGEAPAETDSERLQRFTYELKEAAEHGVFALKAAGKLIPPSDRHALRARYEGEFMKRAKEMDEAAELL